MKRQQKDVLALYEAIELIRVGEEEYVDFDGIRAITDRHGITVDEDGFIDSVRIICNVCEEEKDVEGGTWALSKGMCERCYCKYEGW